jgi:hypothetical protein
MPCCNLNPCPEIFTAALKKNSGNLYRGSQSSNKAVTPGKRNREDEIESVLPLHTFETSDLILSSEFSQCFLSYYS